MLKYHSTPKPVRIRIESGGEEHFSLDSLLCCFNPEDIIKRKQELTRWLNAQGERGKLIVERLDDIDFCRKNIYKIYKAFFPETEAKKLVELYTAWHSSNKNAKNFQFLRSYCLSDGNTIEQLYSAKETRGLEKDWLGIIQAFIQERYLYENCTIEIPQFKEEIDHPLLFYYLGCLYHEQEANKDKALKCFNIARKHGDNILEKKVQRYIKNHIELLPSLQDLVNYCRKNQRRFSRDAKEAIRCFFNMNGIVNPFANSSVIIAIIEFVFDCCIIKTYSPNDRSDSFDQIPSKRVKDAESRLSTQSHSPLKNLILFVLYIIMYDDYEPRTTRLEGFDRLRELAKGYHPAKFLIYDKEKDAFLDEKSFREIDTTGKIDFILEHIIYFLPDIIKEELMRETRNFKGGYQ